jgi:hypothetical protein
MAPPPVRFLPTACPVWVTGSEVPRAQEVSWRAAADCRNSSRPLAITGSLSWRKAISRRSRNEARSNGVEKHEIGRREQIGPPRPPLFDVPLAMRAGGAAPPTVIATPARR